MEVKQENILKNTIKIENNKRPILLIDGFNFFIRNFMVNESVNSKSEPVGGTMGFIKSLKNIVGMFKPEKIIVAFESGGGSPRRKHIFPEYKANRAKVKELAKVMKPGKEASLKEVLKYDEDTKVKQLILLTNLLKTMPICQIFVKDVEGDDIVAYIAKEKYGKNSPYKDQKKIIVSTDKDYYQLLDDPNVTIYDPAKKAVIDGKYVLETYHISARNFCLAKAISGDDSDNIPGVPGVAFKSLASRFKILADQDRDITFDDIMVECQKNKDFILTEEKKVNKKKAIVETKIKKKKAPRIFNDILQCEEIIKRNWKLMYLNSSTMSWDQIQKVDATLDNFVPKRDQVGMFKLLTGNGIVVDFDLNGFCLQLQQLITK